MKFTLKNERKLVVEDLFKNKELSSDEKLMLIYMYKVSELDTDEIQETQNYNVMEMLFKLLAKSLITVRDESIILFPLTDKEKEERKQAIIQNVKAAVDELVRADKEPDSWNVSSKAGLRSEFVEKAPELTELIHQGKERLQKIRAAERLAEEQRRQNALKYTVDKSGSVVSVETPKKEEIEYKTEKAFDEMNLKEKVLHLYKTSKMSQKQMADYIGTSQGSVSVTKRRLEKEGKL